MLFFSLYLISDFARLSRRRAVILNSRQSVFSLRLIHRLPYALNEEFFRTRCKIGSFITEGCCHLSCEIGPVARSVSAETSQSPAWILLSYFASRRRLSIARRSTVNPVCTEITYYGIYKFSRPQRSGCLGSCPPFFLFPPAVIKRIVRRPAAPECV